MSNEATLQALAIIYAKRIGLKARPGVYTSARRFNKAERDLGCNGTKIGRKLKANERLALSCSDCNIMYINKKRVDTIYQEVGAVIHELVHLRWHKLEHGSSFNKRVKLIMKGKTYK